MPHQMTPYLYISIMLTQNERQKAGMLVLSSHSLFLILMIRQYILYPVRCFFVFVHVLDQFSSL